VELGEIGSFDCVLNGLLALVLNVEDWNAWVKRMEVVGVVFIALNHFLAVAPFLPVADGPRP
jgi:extradiol dioxygenase family protein